MNACAGTEKKKQQGAGCRTSYCVDVHYFLGSMRRLVEARQLIREQPCYFAVYWLLHSQYRGKKLYFCWFCLVFFAWNIAKALLLSVQYKEASNQKRERTKGSDAGAAGGRGQ